MGQGTLNVHFAHAKATGRFSDGGKCYLLNEAVVAILGLQSQYQSNKAVTAPGLGQRGIKGR